MFSGFNAKVNSVKNAAQKANKIVQFLQYAIKIVNWFVESISNFPVYGDDTK